MGLEDGNEIMDKLFLFKVIFIVCASGTPAHLRQQYRMLSKIIDIIGCFRTLRYSAQPLWPLEMKIDGGANAGLQRRTISGRCSARFKPIQGLSLIHI